jgi:hypothetical protein
MVNFFVFSSEDGLHDAINLDLVREVKQDNNDGTVSVLFDSEHVVSLEGENAKKFILVFRQLNSKSEASMAVEAIKTEETAKDTPKRPAGRSESAAEDIF